MATQQELSDLDLHWSQVITTLYPAIGIVVKGEPGSIESLLSVWNTGNPAYTAPTEAELLGALTTVLSIASEESAVITVQSSAESEFGNLPGWAHWTPAEAEAWIETNVTDLASAKTVLKNLAKAVLYLRNHDMPSLQG